VSSKNLFRKIFPTRGPAFSASPVKIFEAGLAPNRILPGPMYVKKVPRTLHNEQEQAFALWLSKQSFKNFTCKIEHTELVKMHLQNHSHKLALV
jgi:hypothetical protein